MLHVGDAVVSDVDVSPLVDVHSCDLESEIGQGSTFRVSLPLFLPKDDGPETTPESPAAPVKKRMRP